MHKTTRYIKEIPLVVNNTHGSWLGIHRQQQARGWCWLPCVVRVSSFFVGLISARSFTSLSQSICLLYIRSLMLIFRAVLTVTRFLLSLWQLGLLSSLSWLSPFSLGAFGSTAGSPPSHVAGKETLATLLPFRLQTCWSRVESILTILTTVFLPGHGPRHCCTGPKTTGILDSFASCPSNSKPQHQTQQYLGIVC